jgi:hypothetical protein
MAKRVAAKTTKRGTKTKAKRTVTKTKAKRAVTKKALTKAPGPPPPQGDAAAETVIVDVVEKPVPGVTVITEFEATRVQDSERHKSGRPAFSGIARAVRSEWGAGPVNREPPCFSWTQRESVHPARSGGSGSAGYPNDVARA